MYVNLVILKVEMQCIFKGWHYNIFATTRLYFDLKNYHKKVREIIN